MGNCYITPHWSKIIMGFDLGAITSDRKWRTNGAQICFNIKMPTPYMGSVGYSWGYFPIFMGLEMNFKPSAA